MLKLKMVKHKMKSQNGFGAVEGILACIVICAAGLTGWYVWHSSESKTANLNTTSSNSTGSNGSGTQLQSGLTSGPGSTWNTYTNKTLGFTIQIPKQFYDSIGGQCKYYSKQKSYYA